MNHYHQWKKNNVENLETNNNKDMKRLETIEFNCVSFNVLIK